MSPRHPLRRLLDRVLGQFGAAKKTNNPDVRRDDALGGYGRGAHQDASVRASRPSFQSDFRAVGVGESKSARSEPPFSPPSSLPCSGPRRPVSLSRSDATRLLARVARRRAERELSNKS